MKKRRDMLRLRRYSACCWRATFRAATARCRWRGLEAPRRFSGDATSISKDTNSVVINWKHQRAWSRFHYVWLRDCCLCPQCLHPNTQQRLLDTLKIPLDLSPATVELREGKLCVLWPDGHVSEYPMEWLIEKSYEHEGLQGIRTSQCVEHEPVLWGREIGSSPPCVDHAAVMGDDKELYSWLSKMDRYGFCFVDGVPPTSEATGQVMERIGCLRDTFYGRITLVSSDLKHSDTAYTSLSIDSHTDGNYFRDAPGLEAFHALHFEGTGGQSTLVDGFKIAEEIRTRDPAHYKILSSVRLPYHHTDSENRMVNTFVPFTLDPETGKVMEVHFNNADRMPISARSIEGLEALEEDGKLGGHPMTRLYRAIQGFIHTAKDESLRYEFQLRPGKLLSFNNHRVLHGRAAYTGQRTLCALYINQEDWRSRLTVLREKYEDKL